MVVARSRVGFREVLGVPEFRAMWLAELLSICGDQLARVALSVMVFDSTHSASLTAMTYALTFAPSLIGGLILTGSADRMPRREVMVAVDVLRAALMLLVAVPALPFWVLCVLVGSVSFLNPAFKAAQLALMPTVLSGDRFATGMAIRNMTLQSGQLAGFAGGGLLIATVSPRMALVLDAATFVASALLIRTGLRFRPAATAGSREQPPPSGWLRSLRQGGRKAFADKKVRTLMLLIWLMAGIPVYESLAAPYAAALGADSAAVGLLLACDPLGGVIGAYVYSRWVPARHRPRVLGPLAVLAPVPLVLCLLRPDLAATIPLFIVSGGLGTIVVMQATTSMTVTVPDSSRGQVLGLSNTGLTTAAGLSPLLAGVVADHLGAAATVGWLGFIYVMLAIPLAVVCRRALIPTDPPPDRVEATA